MFVQVETGSNSFSVLTLAVIVYTTMLGTRRVLAMVSIIFIPLTPAAYSLPSVHFSCAVHQEALFLQVS